MIAFAVLAALLMAGALLLVLPPLLRARGAAGRAAPRQSETALAVLREQLAELDAERAAGRIDDDAYGRAREELERRVLEEGQGGDAAADAGSAPRWAIGVGLGLPLAAFALYLVLGNPAGLDPAQVAGEGHGMPREQVEQLVGQLATRLEAEPDNLEGWTMLARSYMVLGEFSRAAAAYAHLAERQPQDADVFADWADAVAAGAGGVNAEAEGIAERALAIDPGHFKALALVGTAAFERADYARAAELWERILVRLPADEPAADSLRASIAEARARGGLPPLAGTAPQPGGAAGGAPAGGETAALRVRGEVTLDAKLAERAAPGDTVFVFVRAADGRMPLAGIRLTVAELPARFDFAQVPLLMEGAPVPAEIVVGARVSKQGDAMPAAGDLEGFSAPVSPSAQSVAVVIDRVR